MCEREKKRNACSGRSVITWLINSDALSKILLSIHFSPLYAVRVVGGREADVRQILCTSVGFEDGQLLQFQSYINMRSSGCGGRNRNVISRAKLSRKQLKPCLENQDKGPTKHFSRDRFIMISLFYFLLSILK